MIRLLILAAVTGICLLIGPAAAAGDEPPPEYATYVAALRKADAISDPLQRCLAYPDLPGNTWAPGLARTRCTMFLTPPRYSLDAIGTLLTQPEGSQILEASFRSLLDAHFSDPDQREHIFVAFGVFADKDLEKAERIARAWLKAEPKSPFAHAALGRVLARRGWDARGTGFVADTPAENLRQMSEFFLDAATAYGVALTAEPKLLPACTGLMAIGRQSSDDLQAYASKQCLEADPASYFVAEERLNAAEPRWGGSYAAMRAATAYALEKAPENPALRLLGFYPEHYQIERMQDGDTEALSILEPAALQIPNAAYLRLVGGAYLRRNENWKALAYLSQALRFSPGYAQESRFRALALYELGEPAWARADAERAVALDPGNGHAQKLLGNIVRKLDGAAAALPHFKHALEDAATREYAFNDYCGSLIDAKRTREADRCVDDLLAAYPQNPEGWRQRLYLIGFDAPRSREAMERFLELNDPKRWSYHAAAADVVRKVLAAKNGTASASDLFDARVARARALERTTTGRAYYERIKGSPNRFLADALGACNASLKPGVPRMVTAVMDAKPDGTLANVAVRPTNEWTTCLARHHGTKWKLPPPPDGFGESGYPILYEIRLK